MHVVPLGDRALLIQLGSTIDDETHRRVRAISARLKSSKVPGLIEIVPAFASVAVHYDPARAPYVRFAEAVQAALANLGDESLPAPRTVEIPVRYGGEDGPDLAVVADAHGLSADDVVRLHSAATYRVYMLGFAPGFAYLGGLPESLATPRRAEPRTAVPAGSVGIGGSQTGIYPLTTPGGWQIVGRTSLTLFDPRRTPPTLLAIGDIVRFRVVAPDESA
ncbi:MAG TPA: 5-oxoprolinase subunit PxpB [Casimicrobiaceae bacterium]|nr:5-oxoprolinase subunit PxpB [Casimicrobiaceae bacterium]